MDRNLESILSETMYRFTTLLDTVSSLVCIQDIIKKRLNTHLQSCYPQISPKLTIDICDILWPCLYCQTDNPMWSSLIANLSLFQMRRKIIIWLIFFSMCSIIFTLGILTLRSILVKCIACIIESSDEIMFVICWIDISCTSQDNHLNLVGGMTCHRQTHESIISLFIWIEVIEQSSHRTWLSIDVAFGHCEIIGTKNTLPWTPKWLGQYLYWDNTWFGSYFPFSQNIF